MKAGIDMPSRREALEPLGPSRRAALGAAVWSMPVMVVAGAAPAMAASGIDLALTVPASSTVNVGATGTITFTLSNPGTLPTDGTPVVVTFAKPVSGSIVAGTMPSGWSAVNNSDGTVTATGPSIAANSSITLPISFTAPASGGTVTLTGVLSAGSGGDSDTSNNTATTSISVAGVPDMTIKVSTTATVNTPNTPVQITYTATNVGTAQTTGVITVRIDKPLYGSWTAASVPAGWILSTDAIGYQLYTFNGVMTVGQTAVFVFDYVRTQTLEGNVFFRGVVLPFSGGETNTTNNTSSVTLPMMN